MYRILVTGCAGFIGSHLSETLIKKGYKVVGIDNLSNGKLSNIQSFRNNKNFNFLKCDFGDKEKLSETLSQVDIVYHLFFVLLHLHKIFYIHVAQFYYLLQNKIDFYCVE